MDNAKLDVPYRVMGQTRTYLRSKLQLMKTTAAINFNRECSNEGIVPNYARVKIKNNNRVGQRVKQISENMWVKLEIRQLHYKQDWLSKKVYLNHLWLSKNMTVKQFDNFLCYVEDIVTFEQQKVTETHRKKLLMLRRRLDKCNKRTHAGSGHKFYDRVVNHTNIIFDNDEWHLLQKGNKYTVRGPVKSRDIKILLAEVRNVMNTAKLSRPQQDLVNSKIFESLTLRKAYHGSVHRNKGKDDSRIITAINRKLKENNALILKADKGNTLVIWYADTYITKVKEFFDNNGIIQLTYDPTKAFVRRLKSTLSDTTFLFNKEKHKYLHVMNPHAPTLRAQPKIHKVNSPIRPIVNYRGSPAYKLSMELNDVLNKHYVFQQQFSITNTYELVNRVKDIKIPVGYKWMSLDITNLYTNVPVNETLLIVKKNLLKYSTLTIGEIDDFLRLLELVLSYNYFAFNGEYYKQNEGLAMGCCLSGTLANIFINHLELSFYERYPDIAGQILYYYRYVDDTILLYNDTNSHRADILETFNGLHKSIVFTHEVETENSINFLDITLTNIEGKHGFDIYRKPTTTDVVIPRNSMHCDKYKMSFFHSMLNRMVKITLTSDKIEREILILKDIAVNNGYQPAIVDRIHQKIVSKKSNSLNEITLQKGGTYNKPYFNIRYLGKISETIERAFRKVNVAVSFKNCNNIEKSLIHSVEEVDVFSKSGVYRICCSDCDLMYIGQTGRSFKERYNEHTALKAVKHSAFKEHLRTSNHTVSCIKDNLQILYILDKGGTMNVAEEMEIYIQHNKEPEKLLNEQLEFKNKMFFDCHQVLLYGNG